MIANAEPFYKIPMTGGGVVVKRRSIRAKMLFNCSSLLLKTSPIRSPSPTRRSIPAASSARVPSYVELGSTRLVESVDIVSDNDR